jgi:biotin-(acetyl-CoA carboxylase) ligase
VVGSNKIAGILIETVPLANNGYAALLGIGVNVGQRQFDPAVRYRIPPTSMQLELNGEPPPVSVVSTSICKSLDALYMAGGGNIEDINGRYGAALVTGERQSGIDAVTGERLTGTLKQVRFTDGTAGLEIAGGHLRYAFPDGFGE